MNPMELRRLEAEFREALIGSPLEWVVDEVDAAIADGVPEEKILRRRRSARAAADFDANAEAARFETIPLRVPGEPGYEAVGRSGQVVVTTRPLEPDERLNLLLHALRRVLVELPEIERESLKTLAAVPPDEDGDRAAVFSVGFVADEDVPRRGRRGVELSASRWAEERRRLASLFGQSTEEIQL